MDKFTLIRQIIRKFFLTVFLLILLNNGCSNDSDSPLGSGSLFDAPPETEDGWLTTTPSRVGINESLLVNLVENINRNEFRNIHSIVIVKGDMLVFEKYWRGHDFGYNSPDYQGTITDYDVNTQQNTHSATKSITSALVGIAVDKGFIRSENDVIFDYLPAFYDTWKNEGRENITIKDCLMMASGLLWNEWEVSVSNNNHDIVRFNQDANPIRYLLSKPLVTQPGSSFYYNGGTVDLLGVLIANATGSTVQQFSRENLFEPMGITNYNWQTLYPSRITCCHGDIYITPRDLAKFGYLFLNNGSWNGEQIISSEWVQKSEQNLIDPGVTWADGYGYLWWLRDFQVNNISYHSFKAMGWGGQEIFIFRNLNMVIVFTGSNYVANTPCDEIVRNYILPSVQ